MVNLTIKNKSYPVQWDYSVIRFFCNRRGIEKVADYTNRVKLITFDENLTIEQLEDLSYMVVSLIDRGVEIAGGINDVSVSDAFDWIYSDFNNITVLSSILAGAVREVTPAKQKKSQKKKKAH